MKSFTRLQGKKGNVRGKKRKRFYYSWQARTNWTPSDHL